MSINIQELSSYYELIDNITDFEDTETILRFWLSDSGLNEEDYLIMFNKYDISFMEVYEKSEILNYLYNIDCYYNKVDLENEILYQLELDNNYKYEIYNINNRYYLIVDNPQNVELIY